MTRKNSDLKRKARMALQGNYGLLIGMMVFLSLIDGLCGSLSATLFGGSSAYSYVMSQILGFILSLITSVLAAGLYFMFLNVSRGKKAGYGDLVYLFRHHPDRIILVSVLLIGVQYIFLVPSLILSYQFETGSMADVFDVMMKMGIMMLVMFAGVLLAGLVTMPFAMSYYLLVDREEMGAVDALKGSMQLMKGHYGSYLYMMLSFAGLLALGFCSMYIGLIWVMPYIQMTQVQFYQDLIGEFIEKEKVEEKNAEKVSDLVDGYNAEA